MVHVPYFTRRSTVLFGDTARGALHPTCRVYDYGTVIEIFLHLPDVHFELPIHLDSFSFSFLHPFYHHFPFRDTARGALNPRCRLYGHGYYEHQLSFLPQYQNLEVVECSRTTQFFYEHQARRRNGRLKTAFTFYLPFSSLPHIAEMAGSPYRWEVFLPLWFRA